jgi:hypothetical protein
MRKPETGALGIPLLEVGGAVQEMASVLIDRDHPEDQVIHQLRDGIKHGWFHEDEFWDQVLGPAVDKLAEWLDLPPYPESNG